MESKSEQCNQKLLLIFYRELFPYVDISIISTICGTSDEDLTYRVSICIIEESTNVSTFGFQQKNY